MMLAERVYALALIALPARFRGRHGAAMRQLFRDRYRERAKRGWRSGSAFLVRSLLDLLWSALVERIVATRLWLLFPDFHNRLAASEREYGLKRFPLKLFAHTVLLDVRFALRMFLRSPAFSGLTVLALALGIGGSSAIFSIIDGVLLKPLPFAAASELVMIWTDNTRERRPDYPMAPANFLDYRAAARHVRDVEAMYSFIVATPMRTEAGTEQVTMSVLSAGMFSVLGRPAAMGRTFVPSDTNNVAVLSDSFWTRRFGRDPSVVGRQVVLGSQPVIIVGIMPDDFVFPFKGMLGPTGFTTKIDADLWTVLDPADRTTQFLDASGNPSRTVHFLAVLGRLVPGATLAQAQDEALSIARTLEQSFPDSNRGLQAKVVPLHEQAVGKARAALFLIGAGVALVLLLACVNVANLLLARSVGRQKEMAVRAALGAARSRLLRQTITETVLLSAIGAAVGLLFVQWFTRAFAAFAPSDIPRLQTVDLDWRVFAFTALVTVITGVTIGLIPAIAAGRANVQGTLNEASRGSSSGARGRRVRAVLVTVQVALAVMLTAGAGLLVRSFVALTNVNAGFQAEQLLTLQLTLPGAIASADARRAFYRDMFTRLEQVPGVISAGGTTRLPLASSNVTSRVTVEGRPLTETYEVDFRRSMHGYFRTMGMPILRGRDFEDSDNAGNPAGIVVNQMMARKIWGTDDVVGRRIRMGLSTSSQPGTIVGVVGDIHHSGLDAPPAPEMYVNYLSTPPVAPFIVLRTSGEPASVAAAVRTALTSMDKDLSVYDIRTGRQIRAGAVSQRRFIVILATTFGLLALALAAVGVYGVMALMVSERTQEMGIRLALGAPQAQVLALVVRQGMMLASLGVGLGLVASYALTPLMASQLFGVGTSDPMTLAGVTTTLLLVALAACAVPARRAMRVNPVTALHYE
jgi:putative ABC transport system permease protein